MVLKLPDRTPYWGNELGIWPLMYIVHYKKFMLYQNLMNSDDERTTKRLIQYQKEHTIDGSWYDELVKTSKEYGIIIDNDMIKVKSKWKQYVKTKIKQKVVAESNEKKRMMTKLRHQKQQDYCMQQYIKETNIVRIQDLIRVKLKMLDIGKNQGQKDRKCYGCKKENETTEHITSCNKVQEILETTETIKWNNEMMSDHSQLTKIYLLLQKYMKCRDDEINSGGERERVTRRLNSRRQI